MKCRRIEYFADELAWIEARKEMPRRELHAMFVARFERDDVSLDNFRALCKRRGWMTGRSGHFPAGVPSWSAGRKGLRHAGSEKGWFAKGNRPHTWRGAGHEMVDPKDGYVWMIVDEVNPHTGSATRRVMKHRWLWERANGSVPEGHVLKCLDGDRTNTDPANWTAVPRALLPRLNGKCGRNYDAAEPEVKPAIMAVARLEQRAAEIRKGKE